MKKSVTNISAVGIIFRAANPAEIFIEMKDDGHPIKLVRRQLCPIGGNWIGKGAVNDTNTLSTFRRELGEELSFEHPVRDSIELNLMGMSSTEHFEPVPQTSVEITDVDRERLNRLKDAIIKSAMPFGDYLNTVTKLALDSADSENKRDGFTTLSSYFVVSLSEDSWEILLGLQKKFNNLSNESLTMVTSLDEIIRTKTKTAFSHDGALKDFFLNHGLSVAKDLPTVSGCYSEKVGLPLSSYEAYLEQYEVAKKPA